MNEYDPRQVVRELRKMRALEMAKAAPNAQDVAVLGAAIAVIDAQVCVHAGWAFKKHGRRCHSCGKTMIDFGD